MFRTLLARFVDDGAGAVPGEDSSAPDVPNVADGARGNIADREPAPARQDQDDQDRRDRSIRRRMLRRRCWGWRHTTAAREKMTRRRLLRKAADSAMAARKLNGIMQGTVRGRVSKDVFMLADGPKRASESLQQVVIDGVSFDLVANIKRQRLRSEKRGLISHIDAQKKVLNQTLADARSPFLVATNVVDDTNIWVNFPSDIHVPERFRRPGRKLGRNGRNCHMPALSNFQHVFGQRRGDGSDGSDGSPFSSQVHSPIQAMPAQNWATIYDHMQPYLFISGKGVGQHISTETLREEVKKIPFKLMLFAKDGLSQTTTPCATRSN